MSPRKKPYWQVILAWFLGLLIVGWLLAYLNTITHNHTASFQEQFT